MKSGGKGGANTQSGINFEERVDLLKKIESIKHYTVEKDIIYFKRKPVAKSLKGHSLYTFLSSKDIAYKEYILKKLLPDEAILILEENKVFIIEIKYQASAGSTDEKPQTCDFKIKQYRKLFDPLNIAVQYIYLFNEWFEQPGYKDMLDYIQSIDGCSYYFTELPLSAIGLDQNT